MARGVTLCVPPSPPDPSSFTQNTTGTGRSYFGGPLLAQEALVCRPTGPVNITPLASSRPQGDINAGNDTAPGSPLVATCRVALERQRLRHGHLPDDVIHTIQAARRPSTTRIYQATWTAYCNFCRTRNLDPQCPAIAQVLSFLQAGLGRGLAPNTLRRQVAAIATVIRTDFSRPISHHPWIRDFIKGAANMSPPVLHRFPTWDLPLVLQSLTGPPFEPLREIPLRLLSFKTAFLIAITSARRVSELAALSVRPDLCVFHPDRVVLRLDPSFLPKINSVFHRTQDIVIPDFCAHGKHQLELRWHKIDVRRALKIYVRRTSTFRKTESMFVSFHPSTMGAKVSPKSISRWITTCIKTAYESSSTTPPKGITAHSTRSASTSAAWTKQAPLEDICRAATWSAPNTFIKHYRLDAFASAEAAFGRRVLQRVCESPAPLVQPVPALEG